MPVMPSLELELRFQRARSPVNLPGRPSAVLDDAACQNVWKMASPNGDTMSGDKAAPFIVNFQMVDTDKDGKVSAAEFKTGCGKGWIQSADASTTKEMTPSPKL